MTSTYSPETAAARAFAAASTSAAGAQRVAYSVGRHLETMAREQGERLRRHFERGAEIYRAFNDPAAADKRGDAAGEYWVDAGQRFLLTLDVLRERAENDATHEAAGDPPVLIYDHEVAVDGKTLPRPTNYMLLKILPPAGVVIHDWKRPYMIVDPRAGHGAGIGGFKLDSQVGVALHDGHPVYFVVFRPHPEPGQTMADVMRAEAEFVAEIGRRHPKSPKPIIVGNCQGGWATLVLAAANPDISGPLVINGAPVAYWSGRLGQNPMRYNGGLLGGILPALLLADLGGGEFDGAHLVSNFEQLNPGRNFIGKYYDLFADPEGSRKSFLEFERWWGGFHFMNEAEIRWIIEQLFIGNRLARGEARIERGRQLDLKAIRSPIIVFASWGDNITPPQQALNWIVDTYADEHEIRIRGQRIIYMIHEKVGHLGIFVSSSIAKKEHTEVASTMKTIEALAPGLYEMTIEEQIGEGVHAHFRVAFQERKVSDILAIDKDDRSEERGFGAVARLSELGAELYDLTARPFVQAAISQPVALAMRKAHPARVARRAFGPDNPLMRGVAGMAAKVVEARKPAATTNPYLALEKWWTDGVIQAFDAWRDWRDTMFEATFLSIYGSPLMEALAEAHAFKRTLKDPKELRFLPEVQAILLGVRRGGFAEAVIRMLILLAEARGSVRRDRLERSAKVLSKDEPFAALGPERRALLIREQSIIVEFDADGAIATLPDMLPDAQQREQAIAVVEFIAGAVEEMEPHTIQTLQRMRAALGLAALGLPDSAKDPLKRIDPLPDAAE
jgi:pimeloyl-ACP methyl ester carboxylesterase